MFDLFRNRKKDHGARGYGQETHTCVHLKEGRGLGWFVSPDAADDDYWPLAWCAACNEIVEAAGGIDRAVMALDLASFCDVCYEEKRERNWPVAEVGSGVLGPWKTELELRNRALAAEHDLAQYDWYDWEELEGSIPRLLLRKQATGKGVRVTVQGLGSFSQRTRTWLWSWAHEKALPLTKRALNPIREYGREQGSMKLSCSHWPATERDVFEMTAVAASFIPCLGEHRIPHPNGYNVFLVLAVKPLEPSTAPRKSRSSFSS